MSASTQPSKGGEPEAPVRSDTKSSYFSCSNLPEGEQDRRLYAKPVREQISQAPPGGRGKYSNYENHDLPVAEPMSYWPVNNRGGYKPGDKPGVARGVYHENKKDDVVVVYHDRTQNGHGKHPPFSVARYVPRSLTS